MVSDADWIRPKTFAAMLDGVTEVQVVRWLHSGKLRGRKIGRLWFVHRSEREAYDARREGQERGDAVPPEPGQALGGVGDDAEWAPEVSVREVEGGRGQPPSGTHSAAGRTGQRGPASAAGWTLPPQMDR